MGIFIGSPIGKKSIAPALVPSSPWKKAPRHPSIDNVIPGRTRGSLRVSSLHPLSDGSVAVGYGDWNTNTGGVEIFSLDPSTLEYTKRTDLIQTEAVDKFYTDIEGVTWALITDGTGYYEEFRAGTLVEGSPSREIPFAQWLHVFDAIDFDGSLWFSGSGWHGGFPEDPVGHGTPGEYLQRIDRADGKETRYYGLAGDWERFYQMWVQDNTLHLRGDGVTYALDTSAGETAPEFNNVTRVRGAFTRVSVPPPPAKQAPRISLTLPSLEYVSAFTDTGSHLIVGTNVGDIYVKKV